MSGEVKKAEWRKGVLDAGVLSFHLTDYGFGDYALTVDRQRICLLTGFPYGKAKDTATSTIRRVLTEALAKLPEEDA